ncbi:hypothetical protein LIER_01905 [Lithospermum erythrorhizon]|uniref:Uncharacterized protein n=1 Tax=Lithospermum erythrorhizon TaxID=34254 RepID=A0AAV3NMK7_LITER
MGMRKSQERRRGKGLVLTRIWAMRIKMLGFRGKKELIGDEDNEHTKEERCLGGGRIREGAECVVGSKRNLLSRGSGGVSTGWNVGMEHEQARLLGCSARL